MAQNLFRTVQRLLDDSGALEPNATVEVYLAGTSTPCTLYSDRTLTTTAGSSVTADAAGTVPERWIADDIYFKLIYKDAAGATKYTRDYANDNDEATSWQTLLGIDELQAQTWTAEDAPDAVYLRRFHRDGDGGGTYRFISSDSGTSDNDSTVIVTASGRRYKLQYGTSVPIAAFNGKADDTSVDNSLARNRWNTAAAAGLAPKSLEYGAGVYYHLTVPNTINFAGAYLKGSGRGQTDLAQYYTTAAQTDGLIGFGPSGSNAQIDDMRILTSDTFRGGAGIAWIADASNAPSEPRLRNVTITTNTSKATKTISGFTAANPGVITTSTAHGFSTDEVVVLDGLSGGTFYTLGPSSYLAVVTGSTTLTLKNRDTGTAIDTSTLGSFSAGTIRSAECFDWGLYADGTLKSASTIGVRVMMMDNMEIFGCARGAVKFHGVSTAQVQGAIYPAGFNGYAHISGTAGVPSDSITFDVSDIAGLNMDRATAVRVHGDIAGNVIDTSNTSEFNVIGEISGVYTALGSLSSNKEFIRLPNGMAFQRKALTGMSGAPVTLNWPVAFSVTPTTVWVTDQVTTIASITTTGADFTNASSATGTAYAIGFV